MISRIDPGRWLAVRLSGRHYLPVSGPRDPAPGQKPLCSNRDVMLAPLDRLATTGNNVNNRIEDTFGSVAIFKLPEGRAV